MHASHAVFTSATTEPTTDHPGDAPLGPQSQYSLPTAYTRHHRASPEPADQRANHRRRGSRRGRPPTFDHDAYKGRSTVERPINKLNGFRAVATRYDKGDYLFQGVIHAAPIKIWLRDPAA